MRDRTMTGDRAIGALLCMLIALAACTDKIDAKGEKGHQYGLIFEPQAAGESLLAQADGLVGDKPEVVFVVRSLNALLGPALIERLRGHPLVQGVMGEAKVALGFDPLTAVAVDAPIMVAATQNGALMRLTLTPDGLMAVQSTMSTTMADGTPFELLDFKGKLLGAADEFCVLVKGKEVIVGSGEGKVCSSVKQHKAVGARWRTAVSKGVRSAAPPIAVMYHGDTRVKGEPSGIPFLDALEDMPGLEHEFGLFEVSAPGDQLAVRYRAKPVDGDKLGAAIDAARDRLPPLDAAPASDPLVFQFLLPGALREGFDTAMFNELIGADLFPKDWPADEIMPALASFGAYGGTMALGAGTEARSQATVARLGGTPANFDDAKAWKITKGVCGAGPRHQIYCGSTRQRLSGALARARASTVPAGQALYIRFDLTPFQDNPGAFGFPTAAFGFIKAVDRGVLRARIIDGWMELDAQLKGGRTPIRRLALEWLGTMLPAQ